jgi:hypothetical protein
MTLKENENMPQHKPKHVLTLLALCLFGMGGALKACKWNEKNTPNDSANRSASALGRDPKGKVIFNAVHIAQLPISASRQFCGYFLSTPLLVDESTGEVKDVVEHFAAAFDEKGQIREGTIFVPLAPEKVDPSKVPPFTANDFEVAKNTLKQETIGSNGLTQALRNVGLHLSNLANAASVATLDLQIALNYSQDVYVDGLESQKKRTFGKIRNSTDAIDLKKKFQNVDDFSNQELHSYMSNYRRFSDESRQYDKESIGLLARIVQEIPRDELASQGTITQYCPSLKVIREAFKGVQEATTH